MIVRLDPSDKRPPGEQLVAQIAASIEAGELDPGERLPTIRRLAADLGVAAGTVAKAYAELERGGWVNAQGRRGTLVAQRDRGAPDRDLALAATALARVAAATHRAPQDAHRALDVAIARLARGT